MAEKVKKITRKKPSFLRKDWHKKIKLGSTVKKNRKWRSANGRHNKIRLNRKGQAARPKIGWSNDSSSKGKLYGLDIIRVENLRELKNVGKDKGIIIGKVGSKKKGEIIAEANKMNIRILNRYKKVSGGKNAIS